MNALWLERSATYRTLPCMFDTVRVLLDYKDTRRSILLKKYSIQVNPQCYTIAPTMPDILLVEARNAKIFWKHYALLLPTPHRSFHRKPRNPDAANRLLDVGYHHLARVIINNLVVRDITESVGFIHRAQKTNSNPLVYDLMELFRADVVDAVVLTYLRQKKLPIDTITQSHIAHLLHEINKRLEKPIYLKDFKQCHTYRYCIDLQITKFIKAVNHAKVFAPLHLPKRHEMRCKNTSYSPAS